MATETILNELKINYLTEEQYAQALADGTLNENEIYMTPDSSSSDVIDTLSAKIDEIEDIANAQSDWDVSDITDNRYIKNKPFYETVTVKDIIPQCTINGRDGEFVVYEGVVENVIITNFIVGEEYTVIWNNVEYKTLAKEYDGFTFLGNSVSAGGEDTGEPFIIVNNGTEPYYMIIVDNPEITTVSLRLSGKVLDVHKIDIKYLSNGNILNGSSSGSVRTISTNTEIGDYSFAEGDRTTASGRASHAEGYGSSATGGSSHAEGSYTVAEGYGSHAEGDGTTASGHSSHAEGHETVASGSQAHAEGHYTTASGNYSHAEGYYTTASSKYQHVQGKYNIDDAEEKYAHIVGNGEYNASGNILSNAHTLDWNGNAWFSGDIKVGGTGQYDENAKSVLTTDYITTGTTDIEAGITPLENGKIYLVLEE
jgi:hypothetical protein